MPQLPIVTLMDRGEVARQEGIVYSTNPVHAFDAEGVAYIAKGPDLNTVVSESIAYLLAGQLGIATPRFALARMGDDTSALWFASVKEENVLRGGDRLITTAASTVIAMCELVAFDAWIANLDRNANNVLVCRANKVLQIVAIDFEKSVALRGPYPLIESTNLEPKKLRPTGDLAKAVSRPYQWDGFLRRLQSLGDSVIKEVVESVEEAVGSSLTWADNIRDALEKRKSRLPDILKEIWS